jgi:transposase
MEWRNDAEDRGFFMIRELYQKGWTQTAIAKETGFDRKTIRKYLNTDKLPERKSDGKKKEKKLDPYKDYLLQRMALRHFLCHPHISAFS